VASLGEAFDGTEQEGSDLPIWYDEFGVESQIPATEQALYTGTEPATTKPVPEETQAAYYREAVQLAFCQPNVRGLFLFHTADEAGAARAEGEGLLPAAPVCDRVRERGPAGAAARARPARLASSAWTASTSRTASTASFPNGGGFPSRSARRARTPSPRSSRT